MIEQIPPRHRGEVIDEAESLTMEMPDLMSSGIGNASRLLFFYFFKPRTTEWGNAEPVNIEPAPPLTTSPRNPRRIIIGRRQTIDEGESITMEMPMRSSALGKVVFPVFCPCRVFMKFSEWGNAERVNVEPLSPPSGKRIVIGSKKSIV